MGSHSSRPSGVVTSSSSGNPIIGISGLLIAGISIWALICAARITFVAASLALKILLGTAPDTLIANIILSGIGGVFAGIAVIILRSLHRKSGSIEKSFVSALFSKNLSAPSLDGFFLAKVLLNSVVGFFVGAITGAGGFVSFPQAFNGNVADVFSNNLFPIVAFLGGGFGGPGSENVWSLLFLILVVIMMALLVGLLGGLLIHMAIGGIAGATKASTKESILCVLSDPADGVNKHKHHPIREGIVRGTLTGALVGVIEAVFTVWGVVGFYHPPLP